MSGLVYDIETVGPPWEEIDEPTRAYLERRAEMRGGEPARERTGLDLGLHRIVAIGVRRLDTGAVKSWVVGDGAEDEADLIRDAWGVFGARRLVTYNGRMFDGPALMIRSAILGVKIPRDLVGYRYDWSQHLDLADALSVYGATRSNYSLDYWCRRFGIDSPKEAGTGAQVGEMTAAELTDYVEGDVIATAELYRRLCDTGYLSQFRGGAHAGS
jgi:hypothetical protein